VYACAAVAGGLCQPSGDLATAKTARVRRRKRSDFVETALSKASADPHEGMISIVPIGVWFAAPKGAHCSSRGRRLNGRSTSLKDSMFEGKSRVYSRQGKRGPRLHASDRTRNGSYLGLRRSTSILGQRTWAQMDPSPTPPGEDGSTSTTTLQGPAMRGFTQRVKQSKSSPTGWRDSTKNEALKAVVLERESNRMCQHPFLASVGTRFQPAATDEDVGRITDASPEANLAVLPAGSSGCIAVSIDASFVEQVADHNGIRHGRLVGSPSTEKNTGGRGHE
jgi:hypothetical protein